MNTLQLGSVVSAEWGSWRISDEYVCVNATAEDPLFVYPPNAKEDGNKVDGVAHAELYALSELRNVTLDGYPLSPPEPEDLGSLHNVDGEIFVKVGPDAWVLEAKDNSGVALFSRFTWSEVND